MKYVRFSNNSQVNFMKEVKEKSGVSWDKIAFNLGVSKSSIFKYLSGKVTMSKNTYDIFCKNYSISSDKYSHNLIDISNREKEITIPKISEEFAECMGALNGDGHLSMETYETCIVSHKILDNYYLITRIPYLFKTLFDLESGFYLQNNIIRTRVYSKNLILFLHNVHHIPVGKKLKKLKIPIFVSGRKLELAYLRGLFDTDGTFYGRRNNEPVIEYTSLNPIYLESIRKLLKKNGFIFGKNGKDLYLYNRGEIGRFFKEIKPENEKHTLKYSIFKKTGKILNTKQLLDYMLRR